jgi:uncharacterized membrane protein
MKISQQQLGLLLFAGLVLLVTGAYLCTIQQTEEVQYLTYYGYVYYPEQAGYAYITQGIIVALVGIFAIIAGFWIMHTNIEPKPQQPTPQSQVS